MRVQLRESIQEPQFETEARDERAAESTKKYISKSKSNNNSGPTLLDPELIFVIASSPANQRIFKGIDFVADLNVASPSIQR